MQRLQGVGRLTRPHRPVMNAALSRTDFLKLMVPAGAVLASGEGKAAGAGQAPEQGRESLHARPIPSSGETLPVVGLGTFRVFDVGASPQEREPLKEVLNFCWPPAAR